MTVENFEIAKYFAEFAKNGLKVGNMDHLWCFSFSLKSSLQMVKKKKNLHILAYYSSTPEFKKKSLRF